ncbi:MAG: peptide chain release factor-like protein [Planctomycetaceae bacterium]|nr:peptide chain release factor-like protein [Planctomycetaceae bacterium]
MSDESPLPDSFSEHPARLSAEELTKQCQLTFGRAGGPGGQHRNKVETAVTILHEPSGLTASAVEKRSQQQNRKEALFRLRIILAAELEVLPAAGEVPTELWRSRCRGGKILCNEHHDDAPAMLAEAMAACRLHGYQHSEAAQQLGCSGTQLLKFLAKFPAARRKFENSREERGLPRLKFR